MAALLHLLLLTELEYGRLLGLLKAAHRGHVPVTAALADALRKALFPIAAEFLAAMGPLQRLGGGLYALDVPVDARCWPAGAEGTADTGFKPGEVRVEAMTGAWEDANGRGHGVAWGDGIAARVWRRPGAPCGGLDAVERLLAMVGAAVLLQRMADRGHDVDGAGALPFVADAPPLVPELPAAPHVTSPPHAPDLPCAPADATRTPALEVKGPAAEPVMAVPVALLHGFSASSDALAYLMSQHAVAAVVEALGAKRSDVASAARAMSALAGDAIAGRWQGPTAEAARHAEVAHLTRARRHRPRPAARPARPFAPTVHLLTADEIRATAASARAMAKEVADPERAAALRAAGVRVDLLHGLEVHAGRLEVCADDIARRMAEVEDMRRRLQSMGLGVRPPGADDIQTTA